MDSNLTGVCKVCNAPVTGKYCSNCSSPVVTKRISLSSLLHEAFHYFTHLDKGFGYTLKRLLQAPGTTQRNYLEGDRLRHQKPFSMYLICATVAALILYWINIILETYTGQGNMQEAYFFNKYLVIMLIAIVPVCSLITYGLFFTSGYNFAEIGVLQLYTVSIFLLIVVVMNLLKFINPALETRYFEYPALLIYNTITFLNFFRGKNRWVVVLKSILCFTLCWLVITQLQNFLVEKVAI